MDIITVLPLSSLSLEKECIRSRPITTYSNSKNNIEPSVFCYLKSQNKRRFGSNATAFDHQIAK